MFFLVLGLGISKRCLALQAGSYQLLIEPTPTKEIGTHTSIVWKTGGIYNSLFSFYRQTPDFGSNPMTDTTGDGWAGVIGIDVDGAGNVTTTSFQKDDIFGTPGGTFFQNAGAGITGTGTSTAGTDVGSALTWDPTGRLGSISGVPGNGVPAMINLPWNIDDMASDAFGTNNGNSTYGNFTTGVIAGTVVNGTPIFTDSTGDMWATLVSGGTMGSDWGGFWGAQYYEIWKVKIEAVPEPGSFLLLGTGLAVLLGIARRKR